MYSFSSPYCSDSLPTCIMLAYVKFTAHTTKGRRCWAHPLISQGQKWEVTAASWELCELTHFLSWWQSVVFKESGFGVIRSGCLGLPFTVYEHLVSYLWPQFLNPQNGIAVCVQQVSYENSVKLSVVSLTHCVTHRRGWIGVSTLYSNAKGKLHSGRRGVCSQNIDRREILQRMQLYF